MPPSFTRQSTSLLTGSCGGGLGASTGAAPSLNDAALQGQCTKLETAVPQAEICLKSITTRRQSAKGRAPKRTAL